VNALRTGLLGVVLVTAVTALSGQAQAPPVSAHEFEGFKFTLQPPEDYRFAAQSVPAPGLKTFGFLTDPRSDGTRGMIQVTLIAMQKTGEDMGGLTLEKFGNGMIEGVRRRRTQWMHKESATEIAGVPGRRFEWSGAAELGAGVVGPMMRGVMIVGIKDDLAFSLNTQDLMAFAPGNLPVCEKALKTFSVAKK